MMKRKKWLWILLLAVVLLAALPAVNILVDPLGVFGDPILHWDSYNETNHPQTAKPAWLEEHDREYDSYVIGSSCAASYDMEELDRYLDARSYNMFISGSDAECYRDHAFYLLENHTVKDLVLNLNFIEACGTEDGHDWTHPLAGGGNEALFYLSCAFCSTQYTIDKLSSYLHDSDLPQSFDLLDPATGGYDRRLREVEKIGDPAVYQAAHQADFRYALPPEAAGLPALDRLVQAVADIRDLCREKGARLIVICSPLYQSQLEAFGSEALDRCRTALAQEVDFWDFSCTSLSYDSRYFYDASHFRAAAGSMVLAEIFDNEEVYRPRDFGTYVTAQTCGAYLERLAAAPPAPDPADYTADVPVLMYHHFSDTETGDAVVRPETFALQMEALRDAGYQAVSIQEMVDYVYDNGPLPEKPVCITMDDGYLSNYEAAFPILEAYGMRATVFAIGSSVGHDQFYKDTEHRLTPHFGYDEAREMLSVIDFQSHTYDMHQWAPFETGDQVRTCALPLEGESEEAYAAALAADMDCYERERRRELGDGFLALAYPGGYYSELTEALIHEAGIPVTFSIKTDARNVLVRGLPQSLYALCRWNITDRVSPQELLEMVGGSR